MRESDPVLLSTRRLSWNQAARQSTGSAEEFTGFSAFTQQVRPSASVPSMYVPASLLMRILGHHNFDEGRSHLLTTEYHPDLFCTGHTVEHSR